MTVRYSGSQPFAADTPLGAVLNPYSPDPARFLTVPPSYSLNLLPVAGDLTMTQASTLAATAGVPLQTFHDFNGGTDTATVDASTAGVTLISAIPAGGSLTFDAATRHGAGGVGVKFATAATGGALYLQDTLASTTPTLFARVYVYLSGLPAGTQRLLSFHGSAGGSVAFLALSSAGKLLLLDSAGATQYTSTVTYTAGLWARCEVMCSGSGTTGQLQLRVYLSPDSATADEDSGLLANLNTNVAVGQVRYGMSGQSPTNRTFWLDDVGYSDVTWLGPAPVASLTQASTLSAPALVTEVADVALTQASTLTVPALVTEVASAALTQASTLTASGVALTGVVLTEAATLSATAGVPLQAAHDFNGGTDTANVTAVAAGVSAISSLASGWTMTFDSSTVHGAGGLAVKMVAGNGGHPLYLQDTLASATPTVFARVYVNLSAVTGRDVLSFHTAGGTVCGFVNIASGGVGAWAGSATFLYGSASLVTAGSWVRIEAMCSGSATNGQMRVRLYLDPDSAVADADSGLLVNRNTVGTIGQVRYGMGQSASGAGTFWLDDVGYSDVDWLGPAPVAFLTQTATLTTVALDTEIAAASLTQASTLTTAGVVTKLGVAALTQAATLGADSLVTDVAAAALTQPATLTVVPLVTEIAAAPLTQASTLTATAVVTEVASEALSQPATLTTDAAVTAVAAADLTQASALTASGNVGATAFLAQASTLTADASVTELAAGALTQGATLTADALRTVLAVAQFTQDATLAATGTRTLVGVAALIARAVLVITPPDPITHRPNAGSTGRPGTGRTIRPFTGIVGRP